jgi:hypothetical protein
MLENFKVGDRVRRIITHSSEKQDGTDQIVWVGEVYTISRVGISFSFDQLWIGLEGFGNLFDPRFFENE